MILPYLNSKTVFSYKTSFLDLYSLQNFETIISCRKLTSLFMVWVTQQNVTHLILPDVAFDLEGEMHRKQKKQTNKQTNKKTNKKQQHNNKQAKNKQTKTKQWELWKLVDPRTDYRQLPLISPGARFSNVPVTFRARSYILKSKSIVRWRTFYPTYQPDLFYQLRILLLSF